MGEGGASIGLVPKRLATGTGVGTELAAVVGQVIGEIPYPIAMVLQANRIR